MDNNFDFQKIRKERYKHFIKDFYEQNKNQSNVLSSSQILNDPLKLFFSSTSIWKKHFITDSYMWNTDPVEFGLKSGIAFSMQRIFFITGKDILDYWNIFFADNTKIDLDFQGNSIISKEKKESKISTSEDIILLKRFIEIINKINDESRAEIKNEKRKRKDQLAGFKTSILQEFDKDNDGVIDLIENDFNKLISKNQQKVIDIDKTYIHQFVKISNYIKTKKQNTQTIFESIKSTKNEYELETRIKFLRNQVHTYELLIFHSINMIGALVSNDLITFYEIYESLDKLGIFNSNWENEICEKLSNIEVKLDEVMQSIYQMENSIINEISNLTYMTQASFTELNQTVSNQLSEINSSISVNNLITGIQAYQLYKINILRSAFNFISLKS